MTDFEDLRRILEPVVDVEHAEDGMLTLRFQDGTRLAFLCGPSGRLNGITVQHGPMTPELRLGVAEDSDAMPDDLDCMAWHEVKT